MQTDNHGGRNQRLQDVPREKGQDAHAEGVPGAHEGAQLEPPREMQDERREDESTEEAPDAAAAAAEVPRQPGGGEEADQISSRRAEQIGWPSSEREDGGSGETRRDI